MVPNPERAELRAAVLRTLPAWLVPLVQFNGLVADRLGVTPNELQCLYVLGNVGPCPAGELARRVNVTSGAASRMIERLVSRGYVVRTPDPTDRRRVLVEAHPDALDRVSVFYTPLNERLAHDLADWDGPELAALLQFVGAARLSTEAEIQRM